MLCLIAGGVAFVGGIAVRHYWPIVSAWIKGEVSKV